MREDVRCWDLELPWDLGFGIWDFRRHDRYTGTTHPSTAYSTADCLSHRVGAVMPKLIVTTEAQGKIGYEFTEELVTVGRAPDNMIVVEDGSVSSRHAQFERSGDTYRLKDLGSTNGTRVNGMPITDHLLKFNDRVRFGAIDARFESDEHGSAPLPEPEAIAAATAEKSAAPVDFANASPFPHRRKEQDSTKTIVYAVAGIAALAFLASMIAVLTMHAPVL